MLWIENISSDQFQLSWALIRFLPMIVSNCFRSIKTKASRPTARSIHGWSPSPDIGFWNFYQRLLRQDPVGKLGLSESKYWQLKLWQHCMSSIWCQLWNWSSQHSLMLSAPWLKQQRVEGDKNSTHLQVLLSSCDAHTAHWVSTVCRVDIWWRGFGGEKNWLHTGAAAALSLWSPWYMLYRGGGGSPG